MANKHKSHRKSLERAKRRCDYIRVIRRIKNADKIDGYVVGLGRWVLMYAPSEGNEGGYSVIPVSDIRRIEWAPGGRFVRRSLKLQAAWPPASPKPPVELDGSVRDVVRAAAALSPLVTLFTERRAPDVCYIGRPKRWSRRVLRLKGVDTDARWEHERQRHRIASITRVDFGGAYEANLARILEADSHS